MNNNTKSGIYQIRNLVNDKVYVGQTQNLVYRRSRHFRSLQDGTHYNKYLQRSFDKHGIDNFTFEVIEVCEFELLNERERFWIKEKQSEYSDKGYNAVYAVTLFDEYDKYKKVNKSKRKPNKVNYTDEVREKFKTTIAKYWEDEGNHLKQSLSKSKIDYETVVKIKTLLRNDLEIKPDEVAGLYNVSVNSVNHIMNIASHQYISKDCNYVIKNRKAILNRRKDKTILRMYREGYSCNEIGKEINLHQRNVMIRINKIRNEHDNRCRLNSINKASKKKTSLARTLHKMGYNDTQAAKLLKTSGGTLYSIRNGLLLKNFTDVNQVRAKVKPFNYKRNVITES